MQPSSSAPSFSAWCPSALLPARRQRSWSATAPLFVPESQRCRGLRRVVALRQRRHGAHPHLPSSRRCTGRHQSVRRSRRRQGSPSTSSPAATTCGEGTSQQRSSGVRCSGLGRFDVVQVRERCQCRSSDLGLPSCMLARHVSFRARFTHVAVRRCRCRVVLDGAEHGCRVRRTVQRGGAVDVHVKIAPTYFLRTILEPPPPDPLDSVVTVPGFTVTSPVHVLVVWL